MTGGTISAGGPIVFAPGTPRAAKATIVAVGGSNHAEHLDIRVPADNHHLSGVVVNSAGQPVRRGLIRLYPSGEPGLSRAMPLKEDGTFDFDRVSSEHYTLRASTGSSLMSEADTAEVEIIVQGLTEPESLRLVLKRPFQ